MSFFMSCKENNGVVAQMLTHDGTLLYLDKDNRLHRLDGPAKVGLTLPGIEPDVEWWYHGIRFIRCKSQEEFERMLKLKAFW